MDTIRIGDQVFAADGTEEFGAVREVRDDAIVVYVENAGEFLVPLDAVLDAHSQKVIVDTDQLEPAARDAIAHAHDSEVPGL